MLDPNFDPLAELEHHAVILHHHARQMEMLIQENTRLNGLVVELSQSHMRVTELLLANQNNIKFLREEIERLGNETH